MASIVLSFVGNQDPGSVSTNEEGSIVSLLRGLKKQNIFVRKAVLLFTEGTKQNARDTQDWLASESELQSIEIELVPVSIELSYDPTDLLKAAQEAKRNLDLVKQQLQKGDRIEFNASSGTPAMKSAFSMLQAAGYATNGKVWQVRNPKQMKEDQLRVFQTDVSSLRKEFDLKVLKQFIDKHNYSAALDLIEKSELDLESESKNLIQTACHWNRGEFDDFYDRAKSYLDPSQKNRKQDYWWQAYEQAYIAVVRLKQGNTVEAMLHSYRAVEGLIYEWAKHELKSYVIDKKDEYLLLQQTILDQYPSPELEEKFHDFGKNEKLQMRGKEQSILINYIILNGQKNSDFNGWDNEEARRLRNALSHNLGGISEKEIFAAWCQYKQNKDTKEWKSENDIHKPEHWQKRLLNCINIIAGQSFSTFQQASLFPIIHHQIKKKIENYQV